MVARILSNTPPWVFGLFAGLVVLGLMQARTRHVGKVAALALPAGMVALSLAGIHTSFGFAAGPLLSWALALVLSALAGYAMFRDRRVQYDGKADRFLVPGSWMPLAAIMAIFFAKYAYAVMRAMDAGIVAAPLFVAVLSGVYGVLSGYFVARALNLVLTLRAFRAT